MPIWVRLGSRKYHLQALGTVFGDLHVNIGVQFAKRLFKEAHITRIVFNQKNFKHSM